MSKDRIYRFGVVGTGMIAGVHAKAIASMSEAELSAVYSRSLPKAKEFAASHGGEAYSDYKEFLDSEGLDAVIVCTPSGSHLEPALGAAAAGKHVVVEKPLEVTIERIDEMATACKDSGVQLVGILPRRFTEAAQALRRAAAEGRFGRITMVDAQIKWWRAQAYYDSGAWRGTWELDGGGALMNQSIHTIDLLLHVAGPVRRVSGFAGLLGHKGIEVEDTAVSILEFESGAKGVIQGSTACYSSSGHPAQLQICGTNGSAFLVDDRFSVWDFAEAAAEDVRIRERLGRKGVTEGAGAADPSSIDFTWHRRNLADAISAFRGEERASTGGLEGRSAVELIQAIYRSARLGGQPVDLPLEASTPMRAFKSEEGKTCI